jgi:hypothetical protein
MHRIVAAIAALILAPSAVHAFCGFYVSGAEADLYNNATMVVLMRDGTRTVLSMQNNYEGPPEDFALVVPVPVVLQEENVKTLAGEVFDRVDQLAAPRLVEYWEQDPCSPWYGEEMVMAMGAGGMDETGAIVDYDSMVHIEAQFEVGEYEIVILSAEDSNALDMWLRANGYQIPEGAEPVLRPYVQAGLYFFVAKVNVERVTFDENGMAMLSPLRFHYDSERFDLPIRLGLLNAKDAQDLLVHILAPGQRYEVANYDNVTIPTNIDVANEVRERFGEFYAALFDKTLEQNPNAVVTEYAWDASWCDPCPVPALGEADLLTLGADVIPSGSSSSFVLTRLHARYTAESLGEDLVFRAAEPVAGGREFMGADGQLEYGAIAAGTNTFQGRYAIRHPWEGEIACEDPQRGIWGGPPSGGEEQISPATDTAFAPRQGLDLAEFVRRDIPELGISAPE